MPHKKNASGRHHIPRTRHAVTNWADYEGGLRRRGSLTLWITDEAIALWAATRRATPGGQATYLDSAIQTCLMLRAAFKLALRQARGRLHVLIDSTGLKVYGAGQWQTEKHGRSRRGWRRAAPRRGRLQRADRGRHIDGPGRQ